LFFHNFLPDPNRLISSKLLIDTRHPYPPEQPGCVEFVRSTIASLAKVVFLLPSILSMEPDIGQEAFSI